MTLERKRAIYALAVKYDVIIVEDDREYISPCARTSTRARNDIVCLGSLLLPPGAALRTPLGSFAIFRHQDEAIRDGRRVPQESRPELPPRRLPRSSRSHRHFLEYALPRLIARSLSLLLTTQDRAETICPGSRLGFTVTSPIIAERLEKANESSTQSASGFSQALVGKLLAEEWGLDGYIRWLKGMFVLPYSRHVFPWPRSINSSRICSKTRYQGSVPKSKGPHGRSPRTIDRC